MTKTCKKILSTIFLALCFVLCVGAFAACDEVNNEAVKYTVTVQTDATTPAKGVKVKISKGSAAFPPKTTDDNGKAEFELKPDDYTVTLSALPDLYDVPANASLTLTKDKRDLTITLEKKFGYTVKLVTPDNEPYYAAGVTVGICTLDGNCLTPVALGSDGIATIINEAGDYHVKVYNLPATAKIDCDAEGYYSGENFSATKTEMTITVTPVNTVDFTNAMTLEEKTAFAENHSGFKTEYEAYKTTKQIAAGETVNFSFTAAISGKYQIYTDYTLKYKTDEIASGILRQLIICKANDIFYFTATNEGSESATAEFVLTTPFSSYTEHNSASGTLNLTVGKANTNAIVALTPPSGGLYKATVQGDALAVVSAKLSEQSEIIPEEDKPADADYQKNASASFAIPQNSASPIYFAVTVKADKYPVNVKLKIEKKADSTYTYKEVEETLTQQTKPEGMELIGIPMDGTSTAKLKYDESVKAYRYGTDADSPIVYVKLTTPLEQSRFKSQGTLAYFEMIDRRLAKYAFNETGSNGAINTIDYTVFLRGFKSDEYNEVPSATPGGSTLNIPTNIKTEKYYAKFVNADGVYPLTEELKVFLEKFFEANSEAFLSPWQIPESANETDAWLFPCYYYATETAVDPIVGEYAFAKYSNTVDSQNPENYIAGEDDITADSYKLVVDKTGTFTIYFPNPRMPGQYVEYYGNQGIWTKNQSTDAYTFTVPEELQVENNGVYSNIDLVFSDVTFENYKLTLKTADGKIVWEFQRIQQAQ